MKHKKRKKKPEISRKTKLQRIMFEKDISLMSLHENTGIALPTLLNIIKGRKITVDCFRPRTLRDLENYLGISPENFVGWEDEHSKNEITL